MVNLKINGIPVSVPEGSTILEAAKLANVRIPTLCYLKDVQCVGSCRLCLVEATGARGLVAACVYPVSEGMEVRTNTPRVRKSRKTTIELILSTHKKKCLSCVRSMNCELQKLALEYNAEEDKFGTDHDLKPIDDLSASVVRDNSKCIMCTRCVAACEKQTIGAIGPKNRGYAKVIGSPYDVSLAFTPCVNCGQCVVACPVGALYEKSAVADVWGAIVDPDKQVVFYTAPSVRATLGEAFGLPAGTNVEGKMVTAIKQLGDVKCFNMDVTADLTIMEEGTEFIERLKTGKDLPLFTSCCPAWVRYMENAHPDMLNHLSTCKSPQSMLSPVLKEVLPKKMPEYTRENLVVVSIMPCTAKKAEATRFEFSKDGILDTDLVLTTKELGRMIREAGIDFSKLEPSKGDSPFGEYTGAGTIFGASGGVAEAAVRTAYEIATGKALDSVDIKELRGVHNRCRDVEFDINGSKIIVRVVSTLKEAEKSIQEIKSGSAKFQMLEVMACPGGCVNGGGQPRSCDSSFIKEKRAEGLYKDDKELPLRKSHENPEIQKLYSEFLEKPGSHKAHELLHTTYTNRLKGSYKDFQ